MRTEGTLAHNCPMASGMSTPTQLNCHFKGPNTCDEYDEQDEYNKYQKVTNMIKMIKMIKIQATQLTANSPCSFRCSRIANTVMYGSDNCNQQAASGHGPAANAHISAAVAKSRAAGTNSAVCRSAQAAALRCAEPLEASSMLGLPRAAASHCSTTPGSPALIHADSGAAHMPCMVFAYIRKYVAASHCSTTPFFLPLSSTR